MRLALISSAIVTCALLLLVGSTVKAAESPLPRVDIKHVILKPHEIEDLTEVAVVRDYRSAWQVLTQALMENRAEVIDSGFIGIAKEKFTRAVADQNKAGVRLRYIDYGHTLEPVFYSWEGSAMQLRDTAVMEIQVLEGDKVIHSERRTMHFITLMTVTEDKWKVRVLESVPGF